MDAIISKFINWLFKTADPVVSEDKSTINSWLIFAIKIIIFLVSVALIVFTFGYISGVGTNFANQNKVPVTVSATNVPPNAQTIANIAPCSVVTNGQSGGVNMPCSNQLATYKWINKTSGLSGELINGKFITKINFEADSPILPNNVCSIIKTDLPGIKAPTPYGAHSSYYPIRLPPTMEGKLYVYKYCYGMPAHLETIEFESETKINIVDAVLIADQ